ncbi:MAG: right-handed parallel beta-helix repeat-containing protein [Desulfosudaceae bacterium]
MSGRETFDGRKIKVLMTMILLGLLGLLLSACSMGKVANVNNYEDYAAVTNTIWASLYFRFNDVNVPGYDKLIYKDTVWREKDSPIIVNENTYVLPGVTLTIEPGTTVRLGQDVLMTCRGVIEARGTPRQPITFTRQNEGEYWNAIECLSSIRSGASEPGQVIFENCVVEYGGGLLINSSQAKVASCDFRYNQGTPLKLEYAGGLVGGNKVYGNSTKAQEQAGNGGGINIYSDKKVRVEENEVFDNEAHGGRDGGGGIYAFAYNGGDVWVRNNIVKNNRSDRKAGGIFAYDARVSGNQVIDNTAGETGGGIHAIQSVLENNVVRGNSAPSGGGICSRDSDLTLNLVQDNQSPDGAGLNHVGGGTINRNTFVENYCDAPLGCATIVLSGNPELHRNNIIAEDGYALRYESHNQSPDLMAHGNYWGTDDNDTIEYLISDWLEDTEAGLVKYKPYLACPALESYPAPEDVSLQTVVTSPPRPLGSLRGLIEADTELGGPGEEYKINGNLLIPEGRELTIRPGTKLFLEKDATLRVRGKLSARGKNNSRVVFTGDSDAPWGYLFFENRSLDATNQIQSEKSLLSHCVVENGRGILMDGQGSDLYNCVIQDHQGTGVRIKEVPVTLKECRVRDNFSRSDGGGIYVYGSKTVLLHNNLITGNEAADGGGIFAYGYQSNTAVDIRGNIVKNNRSRGDGGGLWFSRSAVVDNTITGNKTEDKGGGVYAGFALINDNRIEGNTASTGGGVYAEANSSLRRNIIRNNKSLEDAGGVYLNYWGMSEHNKIFANNIVNNNTAPDPENTGGVIVDGDLKFRNNSLHGNSGLQLFNLNAATDRELAAPGCYWGVTAPEKIEALIYDGRDDPDLSRVDYEPFVKTEQAAVEKVEEE